MTKHWVGTWTTTQAPADGVALSSPTIRMFPRISIGGDTIRVRISNAHGTGKLTIGAARVALRAAGAGDAVQVPTQWRLVMFPPGSGAPTQGRLNACSSTAASRTPPRFNCVSTTGSLSVP